MSNLRKIQVNEKMATATKSYRHNNIVPLSLSLDELPDFFTVCCRSYRLMNHQTKIPFIQIAKVAVKTWNVNGVASPVLFSQFFTKLPNPFINLFRFNQGVNVACSLGIVLLLQLQHCFFVVVEFANQLLFYFQAVLKFLLFALKFHKPCFQFLNGVHSKNSFLATKLRH